MRDIVERLRSLGKNLRGYDEDTDAVEKAAYEITKLRVRIEELEARLEVDHVYKLGVDDRLVRVEVPPGERDSYPDGVSCRDDTIRILENNCERLRARIAELEAGLRSLEQVERGTEGKGR